jgi:hypothetical protein
MKRGAIYQTHKYSYYIYLLNGVDLKGRERERIMTAWYVELSYPIINYCPICLHMHSSQMISK